MKKHLPQDGSFRLVCIALIAIFCTTQANRLSAADKLNAVRRFAEGKISGVVKDQNGTPLAGANLVIEKSGKVIVAGDDGKFSISITPGNYSITASYINYKPMKQTVQVRSGESAQLTIVLTPAQNNLNEVVVVGYGTQKKVNLTGAVDQVGSEYFEDRPTANITRSLQGAIPNLNIK
ncbi:MAG: carboxypeptidase-like regulatory domain-containing protein, partial [Bacteroidota bacterium]